MADTEVKDVKEEVAHEQEGNDEVCLGSGSSGWLQLRSGGTFWLYSFAFGTLPLVMVGLDILNSGDMGVKGPSFTFVCWGILIHLLFAPAALESSPEEL